LDPTQDEEENADGELMLAMMPSTNEITHLYQSGRLEIDRVQEVLI
jgi:exosome complex component MTR3